MVYSTILRQFCQSYYNVVKDLLKNLPSCPADRSFNIIQMVLNDKGAMPACVHVMLANDNVQ